VKISIYGAGQVGTSLARILSTRSEVEVLGPYRRDQRVAALTSGADVVVIATTSFLKDIVDDIRLAVEAGSNVLTTAEEAAFPWAVNAQLAGELDELARARGVTVVGRGLNPGFTFDALVVTACGPCSEVSTIHVERVVDLSGFGRAVLRRIGVGYAAQEFDAGVRAGTVTGHIGFPQSMAVVAAKFGLTIEKIEKEITPIAATAEVSGIAVPVRVGDSAGFEQRYTATVAGKPWFTCRFTGHVQLRAIGLEPRDELWISGDAPVHLAITPGLNPQRATPALLANSLRRVVDARPGWLTVADLAPATP
jgi:2,4-diaminopentanoate dehydrogenase